jgi:hypothetical protein
MRKILMFCVALVIALPAFSSTVGFVSNLSGNSADWQAFVTGLGATVNTSIDFNSHPLGALLPNFYSGVGVTMAETGSVGNVAYGSGPGQGNTFSAPLSNGEGFHPASNYLFVNSYAGTFNLSFATPVSGAGLFIVDFFNPSNLNPSTISAYDSSNVLLGSYQSAGYNFQNNYMYFMGIASSNSDIASVVFSSNGSVTGDTTGLDNILFASRGTTPTVPEPASLFLLSSGLSLIGLAAWRRRKQ